MQFCNWIMQHKVKSLSKKGQYVYGRCATVAVMA